MPSAQRTQQPSNLGNSHKNMQAQKILQDTRANIGRASQGRAYFRHTVKPYYAGSPCSMEELTLPPWLLFDSMGFPSAISLSTENTLAVSMGSAPFYIICSLYRRHNFTKEAKKKKKKKRTGLNPNLLFSHGITPFPQ